MSPLAFTDQQIATRHHPPFQRHAFLERLAEVLKGEGGSFGDGEVHRACRAVAAEMVRKRPGRLAAGLFGPSL
jgi:hypothetical protein